MDAPSLHIRRVRHFYFVVTDPAQYGHHGFRTNTSGHLLTEEPGPGDHIAWVLTGTVREQFGLDGQLLGGRAKLDLFSGVGGPDPTRLVLVRATSHPGRGPLLGEDGLEDAVGQPVLGKLWLERLNGADWQYAAVEVEAVPEPVDAESFALWNASASLTALFDPINGWVLQD